MSVSGSVLFGDRFVFHMFPVWVVSWCLVVMFCMCCFVSWSRIPLMIIWYPPAVGVGALGAVNSKPCPSRPVQLSRRSFRTDIASSRFKTIPNNLLTNSHKKIRQYCACFKGNNIRSTILQLSRVKSKKKWKKGLVYCFLGAFLRISSRYFGSSWSTLGM